MSDELLAEVRFSCGRAYLSVAGVAVAMEGDRCRDGDMPNEVYPPIPAHEMEHASIGGESIRGMDPQVVRFFRGDNWTKEMLEYVATKINAHRAAELSRLRADLAALQPVRGCLPEQSCGMSGFNSPGQRIPPLCFHRELNNAEADQVRELYSAVVAVLNELDGLRADCKRKDEALDKTRIAVAWLMERVTDDPGLHHALSNLVTNITAALADSDNQT